MDLSNKSDVEIVRHLLETVTTYINNLGFYPRANVFLDRILLALVSKNIKVGEAVCLLVENGFGDEGFGMSRTILEIALSARYISNLDSLSRSERFVQYYAKDHAGWTDLVPKYYPKAPVDLNPKHQEMLETAKQLKDPHRWSGKSVKELAFEEDTVELDDNGKPAKWEFDYEMIYKWTSHFVHGTVVALDAHGMELCTKFEVMGGSQNVEKGQLALFNVAVYLFKTLVVAFRAMKYEIKTEVADEFDAIIKELTARHPTGSPKGTS
jgi:hypothetical protein